MPIKSISIEKKTKAVRIDKETVMLNLEAVPLDEENNFEPWVKLQLYINNQLIDTLGLDSWMNGKIKKELSYKHWIYDSELISFQLKDIKSGVESKLKYIIIEDRNGNKILRWKKLYELNKDLLRDFNKIDQYLKNLTNADIEENYELINQEFEKLEKLWQIKIQLAKLDQLEFKEKYKREIDDIKSYCYNQMTIHEIDGVLIKIEDIVDNHNSNLDKFRKEVSDKKKKEDKLISYKKRYELEKFLLNQFRSIDDYFQWIIRPDNYQDNDFVEKEFDKLEKLWQIKTQLARLDQLEFKEKYIKEIDTINNYCQNQMTIYEIENNLIKINEIINNHNVNLDKFRNERKENERKENERKENERKENERKENERKENERKENERKENERKENERKENERKENERKENERKENERKENERKENERKENERKENERKENERKENERKENERKENERKENERKENERKEVIIVDPYKLKYASERLKDDRNFVLKVIRENPWALEYASERLKDDRELVLDAIKLDQLKWGSWSPFSYASERLRNDKEFVLEAININSSIKSYAPSKLYDPIGYSNRQSETLRKI